MLGYRWIAMLGLGLWLSPGMMVSAMAEGICPPGYFPIGGGDGGWVGCAPMGPASQDSGNAQAAPSRPSGPPPINAYMALAFHWETSAFWATAGQRSKEAADGLVKSACLEAMGSPCGLLSGTNEVFFALATDESGLVFGGSAVASAEDAKTEAIKACEEYSFGCRVVQVIEPILIPPGSPESQDFSRTWMPETPVRRHRAAAVAAPQGDVGSPWAGKSWLVSGADGIAAADAQAVAACESASKATCKTLLATTSGPIGMVYTGGGEVRLIALPKAGDPRARVDQLCTTQRDGCALVAVHDTGGTGVRMIDSRRIDAPLRGYFAIARSIRGTDGIAIAIGHPQRATAASSAMATCQAHGAAACAIDVGGEADPGLGPYLAAYVDQAGGTLYEYGVSAENASARAQAWCDRDKLTCRRLGVYDLTTARGAWVPIAPP